MWPEGTPMERIKLILKKKHSLGTSTEDKGDKKTPVTYSVEQGYNDFSLQKILTFSEWVLSIMPQPGEKKKKKTRKLVRIH